MPKNKSHKKVKERHPGCEMPGCWQEARAAKGGFCTACIQWWNRIALRTPRELAVYLARCRRTSYRIGQLHQQRDRAAGE